MKNGLKLKKIEFEFSVHPSAEPLDNSWFAKTTLILAWHGLIKLYIFNSEAHCWLIDEKYKSRLCLPVAFHQSTPWKTICISFVHQELYIQTDRKFVVLG